MNPRITLVPITDPEDFSFYRELVCHEDIMDMNMGRVFTQEEAEGYFAHILSYRKSHPASGTYKIMKQYDGRLIGAASLWENESEAEVDYMLLPEYWHQGYATEAVALLEANATSLPHIRTLKGITDPANIPSQRVLIKNGFTLSRTELLEDGSQVHIFTKNIKGKE